MPEPQNIAEVIARLEGIIDEALRAQHRIGYFAALYERVTSNVRRALVAGDVFQDNALMERLDVIFADRFLVAWDEFNRGGRPSEAWQVAFDVLGDQRPLVIQHLLLGMNAHINLDLGIAAATVAPTPAELQSLWPDFKTINNILARLVAVVEVELGQVSPRFGRIERLSPTRIEDKFFGFGMTAARDFAWLLAQELVAVGPEGHAAVIARRDAWAAAFGRRLFPLHGLFGALQRWFRASESEDIRLNIQIVAE
jgi:hypothetical protein